MTFLFDDIIVGPIHSRRMGVSLGVNLLPTNGKICNFNCIYCECGWTKKDEGVKLHFNPKEEVLRLLEDVLKGRKERGEAMDVITFAGNGEPTSHPDFAEIIDKTLELRDKYFPNVKVCVLTNATFVNKDTVRNALEKVDKAMLKIDAGSDAKISVINDPYKSYRLSDVVDGIKKFRGEIIIQTMFLHGTEFGKVADNTSKEDVAQWIEVLKDIQPNEVVIYTLDRDTPSKSISRLSVEELEEIGKEVEKAGFKCTVTK